MVKKNSVYRHGPKYWNEEKIKQNLTYRDSTDTNDEVYKKFQPKAERLPTTQ